MSYPIRELPGANDQDIQELLTARIRTTTALLKRASTLLDRQKLSKKTGITTQVLLSLANQADLLRIKGLGSQYVALLQDAGVQTVRDLRVRNATRLLEALEASNKKRPESQRVKLLPSVNSVQNWINQAGQIPLVITY